jgi:hypothetical protein
MKSDIAEEGAEVVEFFAYNSDCDSSEVDAFAEAVTDVLPVDLLDIVNSIGDRGERT